MMQIKGREDRYSSSDFLKQTKIMDEFRNLLKPLDVNNSKQLQKVAPEIRQVILNNTIVPELAKYALIARYNASFSCLSLKKGGGY